jgi:hypothetical protein
LAIYIPKTVFLEPIKAGWKMAAAKRLSLRGAQRRGNPADRALNTKIAASLRSSQ